MPKEATKRGKAGKVEKRKGKKVAAEQTGVAPAEDDDYEFV